MNATMDDSVLPSEWTSIKFRIRLVCSTNIDLHMSTVYEVLIYVKPKYVVECTAVWFGDVSWSLWGSSCLHVLFRTLVLFCGMRGLASRRGIVTVRPRSLGPILIVFDTAIP